MDAYIFSKQATPEAVSALAQGVGNGGAARVVVPLLGSHALIVAVEAADDADLNERIAAVLATPGLGGSSTFLATSPTPYMLPIHAAVGEYLGFALLSTEPGSSGAVHAAVIQVPGVVGAAVVTGAGYSVLAETTAADPESVALVLDRVSGLPGVRTAATATGATSLGFGLNRGTAG